MNGAKSAERLLEMISQLCNGAIDERDGRELDELLAADPQARRIYTNYMWMHACLHAEGEMLGGPDDKSPQMQRPHLLSGSESEMPFGVRRRGRGAWLWLAAAIVGVAAFSSWATWQWKDRQFAVRQPVGSGQQTAVARITGTYNCLWSDPQESVGYGSLLFAGQQVELKEGLAEITFDDGATVLLEGPAKFDVAASDKVALYNGRLAAVVPQRARGFRVRTATMDVFEVGAEYGLVAQESGAAEVHVFNGLVKADLLDADGHATRRLELNATEAVRTSPLSTTVVEFPADDAKFVRNLAASPGPHDGLLADESFRYPEGPLEAQNGGFGWAGPWFTTSADEEAGPDSNRVKAGSLAIEGIVPGGNRAMLSAQRNRIRRQLATSVGGVFDSHGLVENQDEVRLVGRDGQQVYLSFLQRVSKTNDGFYGVELHRGDGNGNRVLCIGNGADETGYGATSNVNVYGMKNFPSLGVESDDANFFVIKITFGVDDRDTLEIFRNPESLRDESDCQVDATLRGNFAFDRISIANFDGSKIHEVDELRVGTHFLAVTGRWGGSAGRLRQPIALREKTTRRSPTVASGGGWLRGWLPIASGAQ